MAQPQTIARPYAKAIFDSAASDADQQRWQQFLSAAAELANEPEVMQHMHTPGFSTQVGQWLNEWLEKSREQGVTEQERKEFLFRGYDSQPGSWMPVEKQICGKCKRAS